MSEGIIDYTKIVNSAMHHVVKEALKVISVNKKCNLLISFSTKSKKSLIPEDLCEQYPEKMTIILNNQFSNLTISEKGFGVNLTFHGVEKKLFIPFSSLIYFCDRDVKFSIEFKNYDDYHQDDLDILSNSGDQDTKYKAHTKGKIIYFDQFRKIKTPIERDEDEDEDED